MEKKTVSGLSISPLTLGTVQLGMPYGIANKSGMPDKSTSCSILQAAIDGGISSFDTANEYGESEKVLGSFFNNKAEPLFITKLRFNVDSRTKATDLEEQLYRCVKNSITNLRIKRIPVLLLHNPEVLEEHGETIAFLFRRIQSEGLVNKIGVSFGANTDEQFQTVWEIVQDDLYEVVQVPANIFDRRLFHNEGFEKLQANNKIVFVRSIFLQGVLFLKENELPNHLSEAQQALHIVNNISQKSGFSIAQLAVSFIRDLDYVDSLVIGAETPEQLGATIELMKGPALPKRVREECMQRLNELPENVINPALWNI